MKRFLIPLITFIFETLLIVGSYFIRDYHESLFIVKNAMIYIFCLFIAGHYKESKGLFASEALTLFKGHLIYFVFSLFILDWSRNSIFVDIGLNLGITIIMYISTLLICLLVRIIFKKISTQNVAIIGTGHNAQNVYKILTYHTFSNKKPVLFISLDDENFSNIKQDNVIQYDDKIKNKCKIISYSKYIRKKNKYHIDEAVIAVFGLNKTQMKNIEDNLRKKNIKHILYVPEYKNIATFASKVEEYDGLVMIESSLGNFNTFDRIIKRTFDIVFSFIGCIFLIPISIFVRIGMWCTKDFGPIFFAHTRVGKDGKEFKMLKYRTMCKNAEEQLATLLENNPDIKEQYEIYKKIENDPRVTNFGRFLRASKIDEFPQFVNILIGQMSFIGPRPVPKNEVKNIPEYYDLLIKMKPGATGMWQAVSFDNTTIEARLRYDEFYYNNYTPWLDFKILFTTFINIIRHRVTK